MPQWKQNTIDDAVVLIIASLFRHSNGKKEILMTLYSYSYILNHLWLHQVKTGFKKNNTVTVQNQKVK